MTRRALERFVPLAIVAAAVGGLFARTSRYGLLGFDAYPIIVTSRIRSLADFFGNFTEKLMDGRYPSDFHRPLLNFSFALDHAVWGLNPFGYQLTGALWLAFCALALWALLRRLMGSQAWIGPVTGLVVFLLSPLQFEVLPVPPRRPELMCCAFMALALALQLSPRALEARRLTPWPALATLLAIASKETGYVVLALVPLAVVLYSDRTGPGARLRHAVAATLPHVAAAVVMLIVRIAVLGGMGGHRTLAPVELISNTPVALRAIVVELLWPQPVMRVHILGRWLIVALVVSLVATGVVAIVSSIARRHATHLRAAAVGLAWVGLLGLTYAAAGLIGPWYLVLPLAGWSLLVGSLAEGLSSCVDEDHRGVGWLAITSLALLVVVLVWSASYSPLFRHYDEWERATAAGERFLTETRTRIDGAQNGTVVVTSPLPSWVPPRGDGPTIRGAAIFADYSIQAWADLELPERNVRVLPSTDGSTPDDDEILLIVPPR